MTTTTEHLKRLAEAATPGPWSQKNRTHNVYSVCGPDGLGIVNADSPRTAQFIAAANPATIKALCELVEQLGDALKQCDRAVSREHVTLLTEEPIAAYEAFQKGEGK